MGFESMALSILCEEKLPGIIVKGQFVYLNPTRDELLRVCHSSTKEDENPDTKGYRALFFPRDSRRKARVYLFVIDVLHDMVQDVLEEEGIEERWQIRRCTHVSSIFTDIYNDKAWIDRKPSLENARIMRRLLHLSPKAELRVY